MKISLLRICEFSRICDATRDERDLFHNQGDTHSVKS